MCNCGLCAEQNTPACPNFCGLPAPQPMGGLGIGFGGFGSLASEESDRRKKRKLISAAIERHTPAKVIGGLITEAREDYANKRFIMTVEESIDDDGFEGVKTHEAYIDADTVADLTRFSSRFYQGQPVIIDSKTGKLLETFWVTD